MRLQSGHHMRAVLPDRLGHDDRRIGIDLLKDLHAHALRVNEAMLQRGIDRVGAAQRDALFAKGRGQIRSMAACAAQQTSLADWRRSPLATSRHFIRRHRGGSQKIQELRMPPFYLSSLFPGNCPIHILRRHARISNCPPARNQRFVPLKGLLCRPPIAQARSFEAQRIAAEPPALGQIPQVAGSQSLHHRAAQRRSLDRAGNHRASAGIRGHLTEKRLRRRRPPREPCVERAPGNALQLFQHIAISKAQALKDAAGKLARAFAEPAARSAAQNCAMAAHISAGA